MRIKLGQERLWCQNIKHRKKYITTDYNKLTSHTISAKIKQKGLIDKPDICNLVKNFDWDKKIETLARKAELKAKQDKIAKLQIYDLCYFMI